MTGRRWVVLGLGFLVAATGLALVALSSSTPAEAQGTPPAAPNTGLARLYPNQVISLPFVLPTPRLDYLYASGFGAPVNIPVRTFTTMGHWRRVSDALPQVPPWVAPQTTVWSPDVRKVGSSYVMWFSAVVRATPPGDTQTPLPRCLGWAKASDPLGPFVASPQPAICQWSDFGDIDPRTFVDHGQEYLLWKSDDNAGMTPPGDTYKPTKLWSQKLAPNGTTLEGQPVILMQNTQPWQGAVVEAPDMVSYDGRYYLFFSSTYSFAIREVAGIGVATCAGPSGPCTNASEGPWLGSSVAGAGPDEESLFDQNGALWLLFTPEAIYYPGAFPSLAVSRVAFADGHPYIAAFDGAQPNP